MSEITRLLDAAAAGDHQAAADLLPLVYDELRKLAAARMAAEKPGHTLDATALGSVRKPLSADEAEISLYESHLDHAAEVLRRLLEPRHHPAAFLQPADQALHDAPPPVRLAVELHRARRPVLVLLRRDHRLDVQAQEVFVDPIGPIPLV